MLHRARQQFHYDRTTETEWMDNMANEISWDLGLGRVSDQYLILHSHQNSWPLVRDKLIAKIPSQQMDTDKAIFQSGHMSHSVTYRKNSNISRTLVDNTIVDNSDVVGASPVGAAPTTSSFST